MGDNIAFEMSRSDSPAYADTCKQSKEMTTVCQTPVTGQEPVQAISFKPIDPTSLDHISGLVPSYGTNLVTGTTGALPATVTTSTTGYVNGGPSINFRQRQAEPMDGLGVGDVDFDTKCTDAYANLDDVRDRDYHRAAAVSESIYRGVPNRSKEQKKKAKVSCCFASFVIFIFAFEVIILVLAVFNLVNGLEVGSLTKSLVTPTATSSISSTSSPQMSVESLTAMVDNLTRQLDQLKESLNDYRTTHGNSIDTISYKVFALNQTVANLSSSSPAPTSEPAEVNVTVPLTQGCVQRSADCTVGLAVNDNPNDPVFHSCNTAFYKHDSSNTTYLAKTECLVNSGSQVFPIASSLTRTDEGYSCLCHAIVIPNAAQTSLNTFRCFFNYTICPVSIQVPVPLL